MQTIHLLTFIGYFSIIISVVFFTLKKQKSENDFVLGDRGLNFWLTALSAHASDMSQWLFIGLPATIFTQGVFGIWIAIGLTLFMFVNWQYIAPKLRTITEQSNSLTLNAYFENRFADKSGIIRLISAFMTLIFFTIYISSGLQAMGMITESLFNVPYELGITLGLLLVTFYVFIGGYSTVAWIDLFQGFFLLGVIVFIPCTLLLQIGGFTPIMEKIGSLGLSTSLFPDFSVNTIFKVVALMLGWGLGYLGQPHILTKFMGIKKVEEMTKSKYIGLSWQILALGAASMIGLIGIYLFSGNLADPESLIISIANQYLSPFVVGLVLCAILAAVTNVMAAQILVVASSLSEDFYKRWINRDAESKTLLKASRLSVIGVSLLAFIIAIFKTSTIYKLVLFSWAGIGGSFGPLVLASLYSDKINRFGAISGILTGGLVALFWPIVFSELPQEYTIIPAFVVSLSTIFAVSKITTEKGLKYET